MVYYLITYTNDKEFVFRAKDDDDALRYIHYEGDHVSGYTKLSTEEGEEIWLEYLQELYDTKQRAEDAFNEAANNYENALYFSPEHTREDFE